MYEHNTFFPFATTIHTADQFSICHFCILFCFLLFLHSLSSSYVLFSPSNFIPNPAFGNGEKDNYTAEFVETF